MIEALLAAYAAHPGLFYIAWGIFTSIITAVFKPKTPEQYEALAAHWPRVAAMFKFIAALGVDPGKIAEAIPQIIKGTKK